MLFMSGFRMDSQMHLKLILERMVDGLQYRPQYKASALLRRSTNHLSRKGARQKLITYFLSAP